MIQALEAFHSLQLVLPAVVMGTATLMGAAAVIWSQRGRMQELRAAVAAGEAEDA